MRSPISQHHLSIEENLVWEGKPRQGLILDARDKVNIPVAFVSLVFLLYTIYSWGYPRSPSIAIPLEMILIGLSIFSLVGRFFIDAWVRRSTCYAITDRRVLIVRSAPFRKLVSINLDHRTQINLSEQLHGQGTIRFGEVPSTSREGVNAWIPSLEQTPQLIAIDDARYVFDKVKHLSELRT